MLGAIFQRPRYRLGRAWILVGLLALTFVGRGGAQSNFDQAFALFAATNDTGSVSSIIPPTPGPGLAWDQAALTNGILRIVALSAPRITSVKLSGPAVIISGEGGTAGAEYHVLTRIGATTASNWEVIGTNRFTASGGFAFTNSVSLAQSQFFRLRTR